MAPGRFLAVWLMFSLVPAVSLAQTPGDRDLIRERQERLLQEQERRLDELRQLPGKVEQLPAQPVAEDERCFAIKQINLVGATLLSPASLEDLDFATASLSGGTARLAGTSSSAPREARRRVNALK